MIPKPNIHYLEAHPTNMWDRLGTDFKYIVLHYVGAVSTARNNAEYLHRDSNLGWSAHFFVDENEIWQSVPFTRAAGHCGVDYSHGQAPYWNGKGTYSTNRQNIGIEMCCKKDSKGNWYIEPETVTRTVALVKWLMDYLNIPAANVIRHYDVCWKLCPEPWVRYPEQWEDFKRRITEEEITDMSEKELIALIDKRINAILKGVDTKPSKWAEKELAEAVALGITDGERPQGYATRQETAIMVKRGKVGAK